MGLFDEFYAPQVTAVAGQLESAAADLRHRAGVLSAATATCEWDGAGARAFRSRAHGTINDLQRAAGEFDTAAALLRRHAVRVADAVELERRARAAALEKLRDEVRGHLADAGVLLSGAVPIIAQAGLPR